MSSGQRRGRWSGVPLEDRQALRRDELVAAGVQLLGEKSGPAVTVRAACRQAGLTERYFYESFADRDEFVRAVYDDVCTRAMSTLMSATTPRQAVERFVALMVDDPVRGRVLLLAPAVEPVLVRVAAIFWPMLPDLPMPTTMILPRWRRVSTMIWTAAVKEPSNCRRTALRAAISMSKTCRALTR